MRYGPRVEPVKVIPSIEKSECSKCAVRYPALVQHNQGALGDPAGIWFCFTENRVMEYQARLLRTERKFLYARPLGKSNHSESVSIPTPLDYRNHTSARR